MEKRLERFSAMSERLDTVDGHTREHILTHVNTYFNRT